MPGEPAIIGDRDSGRCAIILGSMDASNLDQTGRVTDQDYYHINRLVSWSPHGSLNVGDQIDVGGSSNPYFHVFESRGVGGLVTYTDGNAQEVLGVKLLVLVLGGEVKDVPDLTNFAHNLASHLARHMGELVFEDIRRREFPHLPSRQRCVWLIPDRGGVKYWLRRMDVGGQFQVLRVRVQGRLHAASESYLVTDSFSLEEMIRRARQYWLGIVEEAGTKEIIFEGRMRVKEVMPKSFYA